MSKEIKAHIYIFNYQSFVKLLIALYFVSQALRIAAQKMTLQKQEPVVIIIYQ